METFSALLTLCEGIHRSPVNSHHKVEWRGALMFSLICAWTNGWVNNRWFETPPPSSWLHCYTVYPKKYAHGFCFAVLCCGYTLTDFPISIRLTSLALWQSNDCPSANKATLMNMDKYFMWIHYERLHNHNKAKHNKTVCIFLGIYCKYNLNWFTRCVYPCSSGLFNCSLGQLCHCSSANELSLVDMVDASGPFY